MFLTSQTRSRELEAGFFPACPCLARVAGVLAGVKTGGFVVVDGCVRVHARAQTHTTRGTRCEPRCGTNIWRAGRIQIA